MVEKWTEVGRRCAVVGPEEAAGDAGLSSGSMANVEKKGRPRRPAVLRVNGRDGGRKEQRTSCRQWSRLSDISQEISSSCSLVSKKGKNVSRLVREPANGERSDLRSAPFLGNESPGTREGRIDRCRRLHRHPRLDPPICLRQWCSFRRDQSLPAEPEDTRIRTRISRKIPATLLTRARFVMGRISCLKSVPETELWTGEKIDLLGGSPSQSPNAKGKSIKTLLPGNAEPSALRVPAGAGIPTPSRVPSYKRTKSPANRTLSSACRCRKTQARNAARSQHVRRFGSLPS